MVVGVFNQDRVLALFVRVEHEGTRAHGFGFCCFVVFPGFTVVVNVLGNNKGSIPANAGYEADISCVHMENYG